MSKFTFLTRNRETKPRCRTTLWMRARCWPDSGRRLRVPACADACRPAARAAAPPPRARSWVPPRAASALSRIVRGAGAAADDERRRHRRCQQRIRPLAPHGILLLMGDDDVVSPELATARKVLQG